RLRADPALGLELVKRGQYGVPMHSQARRQPPARRQRVARAQPPAPNLVGHRPRDAQEQRRRHFVVELERQIPVAPLVCLILPFHAICKYQQLVQMIFLFWNFSLDQIDGIFTSMRREQYFRMSREESAALLDAAPFCHLATTTPDGEPVLRAVHGVLHDGALCFHAAPTGEKWTALGRPAVISCEEVIAEIPSYFVDPERACPATTLYRSVQVHGTLEALEDPHAKASVLTALMRKFHREGGHVPITADHDFYRAAVRGIWIARLSLERLDGKAKLAQNRSP